MHSNKNRPTFGSFNLKTLTAAVASALLFSNAYAAALGKLTVLSALGQPLRAEIELTSVSKDEVGALTAKIASPEAFQQANIDFSASMSALRISIEQRNGRQFIRMTSSQPINEPFVDLLLELSGPNGRLVREYTFLLDPPDLRTTQSAQVAPTAPTPAPVTKAPAAPAQAPQQAQANQPAAQTAAPQKNEKPAPAQQPAQQPPQGNAVAAKPGEGGAAEEVRVQRGDTLAKIAGAIKPSGVSLDQMLVALYQANPEAFAGRNMNRLKAGRILSVPSEDAARSISKPEARGIVVAQAADFNNYRSKLAGQVAAADAQKSAESKQSAGGKITAKVEEQPTPASDAKDKLKLSNTMPAPGANADKAGSGAATVEDKIAKEKAAAEAAARVKELEKNVTDLQKVLEVKNKSLAEQQKQAEAAKDAKPAATEATSSAPAPAAPSAGTAQAPAAPAETPQADEAAKTAEGKAEEQAPVAPPVAKATPVAKPKPVTTPPPEPEMSFVDELLENPLILPGVGALLVALGALGVYRARRQKQTKAFDDSMISDSSLKANSLFGSTGGQSVDTNNSVFNSSFAPSASQLDTNEVDPVAEADVYIAYGRDAQAEEILKEALRTQPERHAVRVKLLEIYSNRKDLRAFETMATELYGLTKGEGEDWAQAAAMGIDLDPKNPLYAGGKVDKSAAQSVLVAPTQPLEEQGLATLLSSTQPGTPSMDSSSVLDAADTSYFGNTGVAVAKPVQPTPEPEPASEPEVPSPASSVSSNELDFDLEGMQDMAVPNTIPRPAPAEPPADLASIDFDFLDVPGESKPEPVAEPAPQPTESKVEPAPSIPDVPDLEFSLDEVKPAATPKANDVALDIGTPQADVPPLELSIPGLEDTASAAPAKAEAEPESMDFDLSGINLDLQSSVGGDKPSLDLNQPMDLSTFDESSSSSTEMATKLDLAIAYQEIGDKEGARELLDEVLKGGTPEQTEKAKSLLLELA
ncbi:FimV/HubP family polar landmark protein [Noviherbaspirillum agri]